MVANSFDPVLARQILDRYANGELISAICRDVKLPRRTWYAWVNNSRNVLPASEIDSTDQDSADMSGAGNNGAGMTPLAHAYARAQESHLLCHADAILEPDIPRNPDGRYDSASVHLHKVMSDNRKWLLSRVDPTHWGERTYKQIDAQVSSIDDPRAAARALLSLLQQGAIDVTPSAAPAMIGQDTSD